MKICEHCGHQNWVLVFVKVVGYTRPIVLCDKCARRIDQQAPQCDPMTGHTERTTSGGAEHLPSGQSTFIGILPTKGGNG